MCLENLNKALYQWYTFWHSPIYKFCSLGVANDGSGNICNPDDEYVMSPSSAITSLENKGNNWKFSTCSVEYLNNFISGLNE